MLIAHIHLRVKPEFVDAFVQATLENARASLQEPGVARFEVAQQQDDPTRFVFTEVYRSAEAAAAHRQSAHFLKWLDTAGPMLAEPRERTLYNSIFPEP